jgi:DNA-directed RNA polymerase subunit RPC12/RpoP
MAKQPIAGVGSMPPDICRLYTTGRLTPADAIELGIATTCAECGEPVTLATLYEPILEEEWGKGVLPSLVWGKDVAVMCPRCSFKERGAANFTYKLFEWSG